MAEQKKLVERVTQARLAYEQQPHSSPKALQDETAQGIKQ
jgi:hypothetical protein